jgi:hypothetical protein
VDVVAVQSYVQHAERDLSAFEFLDALLQTSRERHTTRLQTDQDERVDAVVALDDLMSQAGYGAPDIVGAKQFLLACDRRGHRHSFAASRGAQLKVLRAV